MNQSKTQPTKPSAGEFSISDGPVYAGDPYFAVHDGGGRLVALLPCWDDGERPSYETQAHTIVSILNREAGVGELVQAAKAVHNFLWKERGQIVGMTDIKLSEALTKAISEVEAALKMAPQS